jgi:hypothetical protein
VNWHNPADQSPLETTIGFEQVAIEVTASMAESEPDPYLAQVYRFGLLEDFDHMYRYAALMDRLEGKDANTLVQSYSDILPGRPTSLEHRDPGDDLRTPYDRTQAALITKLHALTITPSANLQATAAHGIQKVVVDPRTTLLQSLEAALAAELTDNACWEALIELAQGAGEDALVQPFQEALKNEQDHLDKVQAWVAAGQGRAWNGRGNGHH